MRIVRRILISMLTALSLGFSPLGAQPAAADHAGDGAAIARLYDAYFLRAPDVAGWWYWIDEHRFEGKSLGAISDYFAGSPEFTASYGQLDIPNFVRRVYLNVFNREPDPGGYTHWATALAARRITPGGVMLSFAESPEFVSTRPTPSLPPNPTPVPGCPQQAMTTVSPEHAALCTYRAWVRGEYAVMSTYAASHVVAELASYGQADNYGVREGCYTDGYIGESTSGVFCGYYFPDEPHGVLMELAMNGGYGRNNYVENVYFVG